MSPDQPKYRRYEELRPDELAAVVEESPVVFWPLGLLEHHGWQLPVGFDGLKAERICMRIAERTGGVILPTMWWGGSGGHGDFMWTFYQSRDAYEPILVRTTEKLIEFGFRALVFMAGHYPWQRTLDECLPDIRDRHPEVLMLWGTEMSIGGKDLGVCGDHAGREETSYGLCLFPELVDLRALRPGRDASAWPAGKEPPKEGRHPGLCFDPNDPQYSQAGEDARTASAERGEEAIKRLVDHLAERITGHLSR